MLVWKIALRNIWRHKGKSLVIGFILMLGAFIMTLGNAVIQGTERGIEENLVNRFTGHIILASSAEEKEDVLFTFMGKALKVIKNYPTIKEFLAKQDYVDNFIPMTRGVAMPFGYEESFWGMYILGTNFEDYQKMYNDNVKLIEGSLVKNGERGLLISPEMRKHLYENHNIWLVPQGEPLNEENLTEDARKHKATLDIINELVIVGWGGTGLNTDVRLPIKGIIKFKTLHNALSEVGFMDVESFRECFGYFAASDKAQELGRKEQAELAFENADDIFGDEGFFAGKENPPSASDYDFLTLKEAIKLDNKIVELDNGAYNYISIKIKPGIQIEEAMKKLVQGIQQQNLEVKAIHWKKAAGQVAQLAQLFQASLYVFVFLLFFVAIIIIMNTLSMAAIERTEELGMMRAIGALKSFISKMFIAETSLLSLIFGGLGIMLGSAVALIIGALRIQAGENEMLNLFFGGDVLEPVVSMPGIIVGVFLLAIVTALAMIYPVIVARKITPLEAIARN